MWNSAHVVLWNDFHGLIGFDIYAICTSGVLSSVPREYLGEVQECVHGALQALDEPLDHHLGIPRVARVENW